MTLFVDEYTLRKITEKNNDDDYNHNNIQIFYNTKYSNNETYSLNDYSNMDFYDKLYLDKRNFKKKLFDTLKTENLILSIIFRNSLIYPLVIRIFVFLLLISTDFGLNVFFINISFITEIHKNKKVNFFLQKTF